MLLLLVISHSVKSQVGEAIVQACDAEKVLEEPRRGKIKANPFT